MKSLDDVFGIYQNNYIKIFGLLYPSKNSTGFTERNLSVNFAKAYESMNPSSATWYEFQFGDKNNLHYDAIIINPKGKEILIIESKRFSNVAKKTSEIKSDIDRINLSLSKYLHEFDRVENNKGYSIIGVILADVWDENSAKHSILESYKNKSFVEDYSMPPIHPVYSVLDFKALGKYEWVEKNYYLLSLAWKVGTIQ